MSVYKVSELEGALLDAAVAKAEGFDVRGTDAARWVTGPYSVLIGYLGGVCVPTYAPSTDWGHGGPILERERINVGPYVKIEEGFRAYRYTEHGGNDHKSWSNGSTPLIAAMRCYARSKLGDAVELP